MIDDQIIVLKSTPLFEKDIIIECFSREQGRISVFAKYAQVKNGRFGGLLQTMNHLNVELKKYGQSLYLNKATLIDGFSKIKQSYKKMSLIFFLFSVLKSMTQMHQVNESLFDLYTDIMHQVNDSDEGLLDQIKIDSYKSILLNEGIATDDQVQHLTERMFVNMIESYTNTQLKGVL